MRSNSTNGLAGPWQCLAINRSNVGDVIMETKTILQVMIPLIVALLVGVGIQTTSAEMTEIAVGALAVGGSVYAIWQRNQKVTKSEQIQGVIDFFDPESPVIEPPVPVPTRTFTMKDATREWLKVSELPADKEKIDQQVNAAEERGAVSYRIVTSRGYYDIEYGALIGSRKYDQ